MCKARFVIAALLLSAAPSAANAQAESDAALAEELANPISSLISLPFQYNYDCCFGPLAAARHVLNIQPVIPTKISTEWNLIIRTILPVIDLEAPAPGLDNTFGLGDTLQSFFFSPRNTPGGITWGIGPAIAWPTGTDPLIDSSKWSAGPTFVIVKQQGGVDLWVSHQSHLVIRRCRRPEHQAGGEPDLPAALPGVHLEGFHDPHSQFRDDTELDRR